LVFSASSLAQATTQDQKLSIGCWVSEELNKFVGTTANMFPSAISGLSSIFTWGSICACHIRFRQAWKYHGHTLDELAYTSQPGVIGSWVGL
jgi:amino acid permease